MDEQKNEGQSKGFDMYSQLAEQIDQNRSERYERATQVVAQTMQELNLEEENQRVMKAIDESNSVVEDLNLPRALKNPKSKGVTLLQCFGVMLVILGIQLVIGLPIGSVIANNVKHEVAQTVTTAEEFVEKYMDLYMKKYSDSTGTITLVVTVASLIIGLIWYIRGYVGKDAVMKFKASLRKTFTPRMIGIILLLGIGLQFAMAVVAAFEDMIIPSKIIEDYEETFSMAGLSSITGILAAVVAAPINEELFFRGIIYRKMRTAWTPIGSVVAAALLFSLMHLIPYQVIYTIPAGFALAIVAKRYNSVLPGILIHMCVNGFSFGVQWFGETLSKSMNDAMVALIYIVFAGVSIGGAVMLMKGEKHDT